MTGQLGHAWSAPVTFDVIRWIVRAGSMTVAIGAIVTFVHAGRRTARRIVEIATDRDEIAEIAEIDESGELGERRQAPVDGRQPRSDEGGIGTRERLGAEEPVVRRQR